MNAPPLTNDALAVAREETRQLLGEAAHYCVCAQMHLEIADDVGTIWDVKAARDYFKSAIRSFEPVRAAIRCDGAEAEGRHID